MFNNLNLKLKWQKYFAKTSKLYATNKFFNEEVNMLKTKKNYIVLALITAIAIMFGGLFTLLGAIKTNVASSVFATADSGNGWSYDGNGKLTITSDDAWDYFDSSQSYFTHYADLTTIKIGDGVTEIPNYAFDGCKALTKVTLGKDVREIGTMCFYAQHQEGDPGDELPTLHIWLEATKADLAPNLSPAEMVTFVCLADEESTFAELCQNNENANNLAVAFANYDSTDPTTYNTLKHLLNISCEYFQFHIDNDPAKGFDDDNAASVMNW